MTATLKELGFTEYEAKAYLALLKESPVTGYAAAKNSGVPRSKIYEVLDSLVSRGDVIVSPGEPPLYRPLSAKELIQKKKRQSDEQLKKAEAELSELDRTQRDTENIWNITSREAIEERLLDCIARAQDHILLEIWAEDFVCLRDALKEAAARGVRVIIVSYGEIQATFAEVYPHAHSSGVTDEYGSRWVVFSADSREVLTGVVSLDEKSRAAWSSHQGLVMPITEVVIHDLYIAEMLEKHRDVLAASFGKDLAELRRKFSLSGDNKKHYI